MMKSQTLYKERQKLMFHRFSVLNILVNQLLLPGKQLSLFIFII